MSKSAFGTILKAVGEAMAPTNRHNNQCQQPSAPSAPQPSAPYAPPPESMDASINQLPIRTLNDRKCNVTGKYFCIPCQCENDMNKCNPYMCKCHDCAICNDWCSGKCPTNCHNHNCYCGSFYKGDAGWCCPLFLCGIFNDRVINPLFIYNNASNCDCDMFAIPPLLMCYNAKKTSHFSNETKCTLLGFWGQCKEGTTCCCCPTIDECNNCGFLFFGADSNNCYPFWFRHRFSNNCQLNSKLLCFMCEHESEHKHTEVTETWGKYGCATFIPYCYTHEYDTQTQTDKSCGCFGPFPLSITKKIPNH